MSSSPRELLDQIDHVVVLMMEGRSFDSMLGHLHGLPESAQNALRREGQPDRVFPAWSEPGRAWPQLTTPSPAPGTSFGHIQQQVHGLPEPLPVGAPQVDLAGELGPMGGFVQSYAAVLRGLEDTHSDDSSTPVGHVMNVLHPEQVPVTAALANAFRVCDGYFASAPCGALPNRAFAWMGTALGHTEATDEEGVPHLPWFGASIFGQLRWAVHEARELGRVGPDWRVYFGDVPLTLALTDTWSQVDATHLRPFRGFLADAAAGDLPAFTWIEPSWVVDPADNSPPHDLTEGEALIARVYNALRSSPCWERTLLVLTYGSHGGTYDHRPPGRATPPGGDQPDGYAFDDFGVRVPCILVSPFTVDPGTSRSARQLGFDHTSILALVRERWRLGEALSLREERAHSLAVLLEEPRTDSPESIEVPEPLPQLVALRQQALADAGELIAARASGASWAELRGMFVNDLSQLAEQALFTTLEPYLDRLLELLAGKIPFNFLARWVRDLDDDLLALVHHFLASQDHVRLGLSEHQQLAGWLARFVVAHHAEHLETPLGPTRLAELRGATTLPAELDRYEVIEAIQAFRQWLVEGKAAAPPAPAPTPAVEPTP